MCPESVRAPICPVETGRSSSPSAPVLCGYPVGSPCVRFHHCRVHRSSPKCGTVPGLLPSAVPPGVVGFRGGADGERERPRVLGFRGSVSPRSSCVGGRERCLPDPPELVPRPEKQWGTRATPHCVHWVRHKPVTTTPQGRDDRDRHWVDNRLRGRGI